MNLLQAVHATKVLLLACALAMPAGLPAAAGSGLPEVQSRVRHVRIHDRIPPHALRKKHGHHRFFAGQRRHRSVFSGFPSTDLRDFPRIQSRTRHIRLKDRRHHFARRGRYGEPRLIIIGGGYAPGSYGSYDLPSVVPGLGTYAGDLSAFVDEGNGIYFSRSGGYRYLADDRLYAAPPTKRAKVITVSPRISASACSWEAGVCVVRP